MGDAVREYAYRPRWTLILLCAALFAVGAAAFGSKAVGNDRGVVINGIIELGTGGATALYWVFAALSGGFVGMAAFLAYHRLAYRQRLVLGPATFTAPAARWSRAETEIAYREIVSLTETTTGGQRFLYVDHAGGRFILNAAMLPSKAAFAEVCDLLADRVMRARLAKHLASESDPTA